MSIKKPLPSIFSNRISGSEFMFTDLKKRNIEIEKI